MADLDPAMVEVREEWEVYGDPGDGYPYYRYTWPAEDEARKFIELVTSAQYPRSFPDGLHLRSRMIVTSYDPWTEHQ